MSLPTDNIDYDELSEALADIETLTGDHFVEDDEPDVVKTESVEIGVGALESVKVGVGQLESVTIGVSKDHVPAQTVDEAFAHLDEFEKGLGRWLRDRLGRFRSKTGGGKTGGGKTGGGKTVYRDAKTGDVITGPRDAKGKVSWAKGGHANGAAADKIFAIGKHNVTHGGKALKDLGVTRVSMKKLKTTETTKDGQKKTVAVDEMKAVAQGIASKTWAKTHEKNITKDNPTGKYSKEQKNKLAKDAIKEADQASAALGVTKRGSINKAVDHIFGKAKKTNRELEGIMGGIEKSKSMSMKVDKNGKPTESDAEFGARVAKTTGTVTVMGPIKTRDRHAKKMIVDEQGDPRKVTDVTRSTVVVDKARDIPAAMASFEKSLPSGAKIVSAKDRMNNPLPGGYRDIMLHIQHPNKSISEVQFNTKPMMKAKMGEGHKKYEEARELTAKETLGTATPADITRRNTLNKESEAIYSKAWDDSQ